LRLHARIGSLYPTTPCMAVCNAGLSLCARKQLNKLSG
jgi:hypothetical protein